MADPQDLAALQKLLQSQSSVQGVTDDNSQTTQEEASQPAAPV